MPRTALISGAGIAGPVLAQQLRTRGWEVTVVERSPAVRASGYPVDVRGPALDVLAELDVLDQVRAAHVASRRITFLDGRGRRIGAIAPEALTGGTAGRDVEVPRGTLMRVLHERSRDDVDYRFGDSISELRQDDDGVEVTFRSGRRQDCDVVIGADGLHSAVRRLAFGPEEHYEHYLGHCFAGFTTRDHLGLEREAVISNLPGRGGILYNSGEPGSAHGFLVLHRRNRPDLTDPDRAVLSAFDGLGWEFPALVSAARSADDLFTDVVSQIRMPSWSTGRVALVGDAAHAPSFLSGQGSSLALVGAHVLAGELATQPDHRSAFAAYERKLREHVRRNQALAGSGGTALLPPTRGRLALRNAVLKAAPAVQRLRLSKLLDRGTDRAINGFPTPSYP